MALSLSEYQDLMLERFATARPSWYMPLSEAHTCKQGTFGSMVHRKWIVFHPELGKEGGFQASEEGREVWRNRKTANIYRSEAQFARPLTSYLDPKAYGLKVVQRKAG